MNKLGRHSEGNFDHITTAEGSFHNRITQFINIVRLLTVDGDLIVCGIMRDPDADLSGRRSILRCCSGISQGHLEAALKRERRLRLNVKFLAADLKLRASGDEEIDPDPVLIGKVAILSQVCQGPGDIGRAACTAEPFLADRLYMLSAGVVHADLRPNRERIYIEEALAVHGDACQHCVVQGSLRRIHIFGFMRDLGHPAAEERKADRSAALGIVHGVRQIVVHRKALEDAGASNPACDVHLAFYNIVVERFAGIQQPLIVLVKGCIRHSAVQIYGTDRMASGCFLLTDRFIGLGVIEHGIVLGLIAEDLHPAWPPALHAVIIQFLSPAVQELAGHIQVFLLPGHLIELDQGKFYLFMTRKSLLQTGRMELIDNVIRHPQTDVQKTTLSRHLIISHTGLDQMASAVQFMSFTQVGELDARMPDDKIGIQISIRLLGLLQKSDRRIGLLFQLLIRFPGQGIGHCLQPLGQIGILEDKTVEVSLFLPRSNADVADGMAGLHALQLIIKDLPLIRNDLIRYQLGVLIPKGIFDRHLFQVRGL